MPTSGSWKIKFTRLSGPEAIGQYVRGSAEEGWSLESLGGSAGWVYGLIIADHAYVYLDGSGTPLAPVDLPAGWMPDREFTVTGGASVGHIDGADGVSDCRATLFELGVFSALAWPGGGLSLLALVGWDAGTVATFAGSASGHMPAHPEGEGPVAEVTSEATLEINGLYHTFAESWFRKEDETGEHISAPAEDPGPPWEPTDAPTPIVTAVHAKALGDGEGVYSIDPAHGPEAGGTEIQILGSGFADEALALIARGGCGGLEVVDSGEVRCIAHAFAPGLADVVIENPDGQHSAIPNPLYTYDLLILPIVARVLAAAEGDPPGTYSLEPAYGPTDGGALCQILGTGFLDGDLVAFGALDATEVVIVSPTEITCTAPAQSPGQVIVSVRRPEEG